MHDPHEKPKTIAARESYLDQVVREYLEAVERGEAPARAEFLEQHGDIAEELESFFGDLDHLDGVEGQLVTPEAPSPRSRLPSDNAPASDLAPKGTAESSEKNSAAASPRGPRNPRYPLKTK